MTRQTPVRKSVLLSSAGAVLLGILAVFSCPVARRAAAEPGAREDAETCGGWRIWADRSRAEVFIEDGHLILLVTCPGGIGVLTLRREKQPPDGSIRLRLRYAVGQPFRELEGFEVEAGQQRISTRYTPRRADAAIAAAKSPALVFRETADYLEVEIPTDGVAGICDVTIRWVDYYR